MGIMNMTDDYRDIQLESCNDACKVTCHFAKIKYDGTLAPEGSGVFIKIDDTRFLITAAHIVDGQANDIYVRTGKHNILKLGGELNTNIAFNTRKTDKIDIAILKLNQESIEKIGETYNYLDISEIEINHTYQLVSLYQSVGFPCSYSKYNKHKNEFKSKPFFYATMPAENNIYKELNCTPSYNIIVHYDKKKVMNCNTGKTQTGPDPYGMSGSGIWFIPGQSKSTGKKIKKKLVGIMTEWPQENKKYWIGTRIDIFTEIIRQKYSLKIEQSKIVKIPSDEFI